MEIDNIWQQFNKKHLIIAHRGYRAIRAENTLSAFRASKDRADLVELDVGFSKDGVAIVIHDDTLKRTTDVKKHRNFNKPYETVDYAYEEIKKLDASTWFIEQDPFETIKNRAISKEYLYSQPIERVPTLKEALSLLKELDLAVNVEIKDHSKNQFDAVAPVKVLEIIKELNYQNRVLISSFNHNYLLKIKEIDPTINTAVLQESYHLEDVVSYLKRVKTNNYNICDKIATEKIIKELTAQNINISVFTVNSKKRAKELFDWGVRAIFTDFI